MRKKASPQYILAIEEGKVYESVSAAARELGIDPSNLRAVLAGRRKTAGGIHFATTTKPELSAKTIKKRQEQLREENLSKRLQKARRSRAASEREKLISNVKDKLQAVNQMMKAAKQENLLEGNETLQKMLSHASYYGRNKQGGYYTSTAHLSQYTNEELENLMSLIEGDQNEAIEKEFYEKSGRGRSLASFATEWGLTKNQAAEYRDLAPYLYDLVRKMKFNSNMKYSYTLERLYTSMQQGISHDQLERVLIELTDIADQTSEKTVGDITRKYLNKRQVALWQKMREEQAGK